MIFFGNKSNVGAINTGKINVVDEEVPEYFHKVIFDNRPAMPYEFTIEAIRSRGMISWDAFDDSLKFCDFKGSFNLLEVMSIQ